VIGSGVYRLIARCDDPLPYLHGIRAGETLYIGRASTELTQRWHFKGDSPRHAPRRNLIAFLERAIGLVPAPIPSGDPGKRWHYGLQNEPLLDAWMLENIDYAFALLPDPATVEKRLIQRERPALNMRNVSGSEAYQTLRALKSDLVHRLYA
jgi:hypothetical protein